MPKLARLPRPWVKEVFLLLACPRLSVSGGLKKRAGDEGDLVGKKDRSPLIQLVARSRFSIVLTDRARAWNRLSYNSFQNIKVFHAR